MLPLLLVFIFYYRDFLFVKALIIISPFKILIISSENNPCKVFHKKSIRYPKQKGENKTEVPYKWHSYGTSAKQEKCFKQRNRPFFL